MDNELRRNPETGEVERKVVSYERVELAQLEAEVTNAEAQLAQINTELEADNARQAELEAGKSTQESVLSEAKSGLEAYHGVANQGSEGDESGSEGVVEQTEDEAEVAESAEVEIPVAVENPADQY